MPEPSSSSEPVFRSDILRLEVWLEEQLAELVTIADDATRSDLEFQAYRKYLSALAESDHPYANLLKRIQGCYECFLASNFSSSSELDDALVLAVEKEKQKARLTKELDELEKIRQGTASIRDKLIGSVESLGAQIKAAKSE